MLDNKKLKEIENRIKNFIREGTIVKTKRSAFVDFFLINAQKSLNSAKLLYDVSTKEELKINTGYTNFDGFLWVINASYYSMFYIARALLENEFIKLRSELSIHVLTSDALVYYFYLSGKLQRWIIEDFVKAKEEASEILGKEKAHSLIENYFFEKEKRSKFTYEMGNIALQNKALTSLQRAARFYEEIEKIIKSKRKK